MEAESLTWIQGFVTMPRMKRVFDVGAFEILRVGCYFMNWFFLYDDYSDLATPHEAKEMADVVMNTICKPDKIRLAGEYVVGEAIRQLWELISKCASLNARRRLIESLGNFTASVAQQAQDRTLNYIRNVDEYFSVRRETIGAKQAFVVLEFELNLPDEFFDDPVIQRLVNACIDLIIISNDLYSYNVEQARGDDGHNLVTVMMHHKNLDLNEAMVWIGDHASKTVRNYLNDLDHVPSFGNEFKDDVKRYLVADTFQHMGWQSPTVERLSFILGALQTQRNKKAAYPTSSVSVKR
ncbi:Pentalenene synthase [Termitomyces sp. J132]|nr:Pentalenene synthase [Termitomyces sp. J132]